MGQNKQVSLEELVSLFGNTAMNEQLDKPTRAFAAQMTILTGHVRMLRKALVEKDAQIAELSQIVMAIAKPEAAAPAAPPTQAAAPATEGSEEASEEDEAIAMAEKVRLETEAELRALDAQTQPQKPPAPPVALVKAQPADGAA